MCATHDDIGAPTGTERSNSNQAPSQEPKKTNPTNATTPGIDPHQVEKPEEDQDAGRKLMDHGLSAHDIHFGLTDLHFVNDFLQELTSLHSSIERDLRMQRQLRLVKTSKRLYYLQKKSQ